MANLKEVRIRIQSVISTQQITKAMKMVAAAKLRKAQDRAVQLRPYSQQLNGILDNVLAATENSESVFSTKREPKKILLVVVTSDRGLCGGFNTNIFKGVQSLIQEKYLSQQANGDLTLLCIGRKGRDYFKKRNYKVIEDFADMLATLTFATARQAAELTMNGFLGGTFDVVEIVYNEFKNVATQIVRQEQFLPLVDKKVEKTSNTDYTFEPNKNDIIQDLLPKALRIHFYKALLESNASEQGARMTAMDKATENAGELLKELKLTYNRTRQAAITKEILEIVGGAEALNA